MHIEINLLGKSNKELTPSWRKDEIPVAIIALSLSFLTMNMWIDALVSGHPKIILITILSFIGGVGSLIVGIYFTLRTVVMIPRLIEKFREHNITTP
ncbi:MAG: hypothetical protein ACYCY6_02335 [Minisyncoccota bacterium]